MNFVGHIAVGCAVRDAPADPAYLLGTALPDFAAMAGVRLGRAGGELGDGIAVHHATDTVFHREGWFVGSEHDLLSDLTVAGFSRGAALACAHVGVELVLDGELVRDPGTADAVGTVYGLMTDPPTTALDLAPADRRADWAGALAGIAARLDPAGYSDPDTVAWRLHRMTSRRPRLAFPAALVPVLAGLLASHRPAIAADAPEVLAGVTGSVLPALGNT
jgi:hypothetical protein